MKIIYILFLLIFTSQKEVKEDIRWNLYDSLNLSSAYDYKIHMTIYHESMTTLYFLIGTELNTFPFNIYYSIRNSNDSFKKISVYHEEKKGNLNAFFFKLEKRNNTIATFDFNISDIQGEYALLVSTQFEELNSNIVLIENLYKPNILNLYKNKPIFLLFSTINLRGYSFKMILPNPYVFKKYFYITYSEQKLEDISILKRYGYYQETNVIYDNKTYELYASEDPIYYFINYKIAKSALMVFEPLVDCNVTIIFENVTNLAFISPYTFLNIGDLIRNNFQYEKRVYQFIIKDYYQDIFYFTASYGRNYKYYFSDKYDDKDISNYIELKDNVKCTSKSYYEYCQIKRKSPEQKGFYFVVYAERYLHNYIKFRSTFFDESNYTIQEPYKSYEYQLDQFNPNLLRVIGNFSYNEKIYFEIEIDFQENYISVDNNITNITINVQINNNDVNNYF